MKSRYYGSKSVLTRLSSSDVHVTLCFRIRLIASASFTLCCSLILLISASARQLQALGIHHVHHGAISSFFSSNACPVSRHVLYTSAIYSIGTRDIKYLITSKRITWANSQTDEQTQDSQPTVTVAVTQNTQLQRTAYDENDGTFQSHYFIVICNMKA